MSCIDPPAQNSMHIHSLSRLQTTATHMQCFTLLSTSIKQYISNKWYKSDNRFTDMQHLMKHLHEADVRRQLSRAYVKDHA